MSLFLLTSYGIGFVHEYLLFDFAAAATCTVTEGLVVRGHELLGGDGPVLVEIDDLGGRNDFRLG